MSEEWDKLTFDSALGHKAKVERESLTNDRLIELDSSLCAIGRELQESDPGAKAMKYLGSAAFHVCVSEGIVGANGLPQIIVINQTGGLRGMNEIIAGTAGQDLLRAIARYYGRKPPQKRSGF